MATELLGKKVIAKKTTVGDSATAIPGTAETGRQSILIQNLGGETVYIGDSNVTVAAGFKLVSGGELPIEAAEGCIVYGITSSGTSDVRTLEGI